jgi:hypothetical protein
MRRRYIFNQAVIGGKKNISEQNSDMCFGISLQKNNLSRKDKQAAVTLVVPGFVFLPHRNIET